MKRNTDLVYSTRRQSRSIEEIQEAIRKLEQRGALFLAHVLHSVGPQFGDHVTDALPGLSWHQWGEAVDCFWFLDGQAEWSTREKVTLRDGREINGYRLYGEEGEQRGLTSGGFWNDLVDWPHLQKKRGSVLDHFSWPEIDQAMQQRFEQPPAPALVMAPTPPVLAAASGPKFVQVVGNKFHCQGKEFKFIGFNTRALVHYNTQYTHGPGYKTDPLVSNPRQAQLQKAYDLGARVVRVFLPHENATKEDTTQKLDNLLKIIKEELRLEDLYLIPALTNLYGDVPFMVREDKPFYSSTESHNPLKRVFFEGGYRDNYLPFVQHIVGRFKDEPNILAWEIGNELKVNDDPQLLIGFMHHIAREIRDIDPNHLITTGMISTVHAYMFHENAALRRHLYAAPRNPAAGDHRHMFDFITLHYPGECHGLNGQLGCDHEDIQLAQELEMPFIIEEALFEGQGDRSPMFRQDMDEWFGQGASGYMPWGFDGADVGDGHPGGVGGRDHTDWPTLRNLFQTYAANLANGL